METQTIIDLVGGAVLTVVGWFARQVYQCVKELEKDVHRIEVDLPKNYVSKSDYAETMKEIKAMFEKIFDKLDDKADK